MNRIYWGLRTFRWTRKRQKTLVFLSLMSSALAAVLLMTVVAVNNVITAREDVAAARTPKSNPALSVNNHVIVYFAHDEFHGKSIYTVRVVNAQANPKLVPPGIPRLPEVGEYFSSPALTALLQKERQSKSDPSLLLARYPGKQVGIISSPGLKYPNELAVYIGTTNPNRQNGAPLSGWGKLTHSTFDRSHRIGVSVISLSLFIPIMVLTICAALIGMPDRRRRYSTLSAVGFSNRDLRMIAALEVSLTVLAGNLLGFLVMLIGSRHLHTWSALPWSWWPKSTQPTTPQLVTTFLFLFVVPIGYALISVRSKDACAALSSSKPKKVFGTLSVLRLLIILFGMVALFEMQHFANNRYSLALAFGAVVLGLAAAVAPLMHFIGARIARSTQNFHTLYSARSSQQASASAVRSATAVGVAVIMAVSATIVVQHFDFEVAHEQRESNASWPVGTVQVNQSLHDDDLQNLAAITGVNYPFALRIMQGSTEDGSSLITTGIVNCSLVWKYVSRQSFPGCDKGESLNISSPRLFGGPNQTTITRVATGKESYSASYVSNNQLVSYPVSLTTKEVGTSARLTAMFATIGITILVGENDVSLDYRTKALSPYFYFQSSKGNDGIERVRTFFANKYGNSAAVETLEQRLQASRSDALLFSRGLNASIIFALTVGIVGFMVSFLEDLRRRRAVSAALIAAGVPPRTLDLAAIMSSILTLFPAVLLGCLGGCVVGLQLTSLEANSGGVPYVRILLIGTGVITLVLVLSTGLLLAYGKRMRTNPGDLARE